MKLLKYFILIIFFCSCSSNELIYNKNSIDIAQIKLIESIMKNPNNISRICKENTEVTKFFKDEMCDKDMIETNIGFIKKYFSGINIMKIDTTEKNSHFYRVENEKTKENIYFNFRFENNKWLLNNIHGTVEM